MDGGNAWDLVREDPDKPRALSRPQSFRSRPEQTEAYPPPTPGPSGIRHEESVGDLPWYKRRLRSRSPANESFRNAKKQFLEKVVFSEPQAETLTETFKAEDLPWIEPRSRFEKPLAYRYERLSDLPPHMRAKKLNSGSASQAQAPVGPQKEKCAYLFRGDSYARAPVTEAVPVDEEGSRHVDPYCPVHGSRKRLIKPRLKDLESFHLTSIDTVELNEPTSVILLSQAYAAKMIRKRKRATLSGVAKIRNDKQKHKIEMNLWIMSVAFLFLFIAFHGLQNLQTSVNGELGADSLGIFYLTVAMSSLFVPPFMLNRLGCKLTLIASSAVYMIYMLANFLPKYYSLIPAAILAGCAGSCLHAAKCVYIAESGSRFAQLNVEDQNVVTVRFFGFFFTVLHFGQVIGNFLSSFILTSAMGYKKPEDSVEKTCGYLFQKNASHLSDRASANLQRPPRGAYLAVCGAYFCCTIVALMIISMFLNSLRKDELARKQAPQCSTVVLETTVENLRKPKPLLLTPLTVFNGIEQAFIIGYYTKAYVACGLGISQIGYVMTSFGVADAICSLFFGPLMKLFGRMPLFVFGAVINILTIMTLMIWPLNPGDTELFYVMAGVWGMADGVWNTQINGLWVALSRSSLEAAFANYHFWESSGIAFGLFLSRFASISQVLIICFTILLIGITGYIGVEFYEEISDYVLHLVAVCSIGPYKSRIAAPAEENEGSQGSTPQPLGDQLIA